MLVTQPLEDADEVSLCVIVHVVVANLASGLVAPGENDAAAVMRVQVAYEHRLGRIWYVLAYLERHDPICAWHDSGVVMSTHFTKPLLTFRRSGAIVGSASLLSIKAEQSCAILADACTKVNQR